MVELTCLETCMTLFGQAIMTKVRILKWHVKLFLLLSDTDFHGRIGKCCIEHLMSIGTLTFGSHLKIEKHYYELLENDMLLLQQPCKWFDIMRLELH